jgi:hypothetical protein
MGCDAKRGTRVNPLNITLLAALLLTVSVDGVARHGWAMRELPLFCGACALALAALFSWGRFIRAKHDRSA